LVGVYYDSYWKGKDSRYSQWKKRIRRSPRNFENDLLKSILGRPAVKQVQARFELETFLTDIHVQLSAHVHNSGDVGRWLQKGRDNVPRFSGRSFDRWFGLLRKTFSAILIIFALVYPDLLEDYYKKKCGNLKRIVDEPKIIDVLDLTLSK
jgi:hypothetical protein